MTLNNVQEVSKSPHIDDITSSVRDPPPKPPQITPPTQEPCIEIQ